MLMQPLPTIPPTTLSPVGLQTWYDTHLYAYLGVHGPIKDLSISDPNDRGCWLGVVSMACKIERVASPEAHHRPSTDDWVLRGNYRYRETQREERASVK